LNLMAGDPRVSPESANEYPPVKLASVNPAALTGGENMVGPHPAQKRLRSASTKGKNRYRWSFILDLLLRQDFQE
jgi:hypothetical protein